MNPSYVTANLKGRDLGSAAEEARRYAGMTRECLKGLEPSVPLAILETAARLVVEREN